MKAFIRKHSNDMLLGFFVMATTARGRGQIYPLAGLTAAQTKRGEHMRVENR